MQAPTTSRCISVNVLDWFPSREPCVDWPTIFGHRPTREPRNVLTILLQYTPCIRGKITFYRPAFYYKSSLVDDLFLGSFNNIVSNASESAYLELFSKYLPRNGILSIDLMHLLMVHMYQ